MATFKRIIAFYSQVAPNIFFSADGQRNAYARDGQKGTMQGRFTGGHRRVG